MRQENERENVMAIHSKHTDPELRKLANAMLRAAGYQVADPLEDTPYGSWMTSSYVYQMKSHYWKTMCVLSLVATTLLIGSVVLLSASKPPISIIAIEIPCSAKNSAHGNCFVLERTSSTRY